MSQDYLRDRLVAAVGDHYLIEEELGRGGMAAVFRALDVRLNRHIAIKLLPPDLAFNPSVRSRFLREAQMAAGLMHQNIVPIYTVDEREGLVYYVMALVDGESLAHLLSRQGAMAVDRVRAIVADVADALDFAHRQGVVHRDIKPDNILLDRASGRPMVTDFGIARAAAEESRLTVTGMAVGTPAYMSPEQAMGEREVDGRSDIYSLGIVAYQMLAGEPPFRASNTPAMLMKHVAEPPPPLRQRRPEIPASLAEAVERALAKKPEDRWRSASEFRDAVLERTLAKVYPAPPPPSPAAPSAPRHDDARALPRPMEPADAFGPGAVNVALPFLRLPPPGLSKRERRDWYKEQRRSMKDAVRAGFEMPEIPVERRIAKFRRSIVSYGATSVMLAAINGITSPHFPWAAFPILGMMVGTLTQLGSLWGDGVSMKQILFGSTRAVSALPAAAAAPAKPRTDPGTLVSQDILAGSHGATVRRAAGSRDVIVDLLSRMTPKEREMLPADVDETVKALMDRVASLATTLHRLDSEANGATLGSLDERVETLKREPTLSGEGERRLALLERQRTTLRDLLERRAALLTQMESASLALENLKLDLVRFRSAGVSNALEDVTSATREARALSRDIGHMLDAADEVRRL
ncbi:MAG TPA: protein kinase [Gemmatimonadaceae bacterium]|nr:protein kinase [Gemmatimonadaceae bacterium]